MSRQPHHPAEIYAEPGPLPDTHAVTLMEHQVVNLVERSHSAELTQLLIDIGTVRMASASENFSALVRISKDAAIKESKAYKSLRGQFSADERKTLSGTWEEYCSMSGRSVDVVDRGIANLKAFGAEALESMLRIGVSQRDFSQYRRLPADERAALIEAAKAGDKDELLDLAETLISRHSKEKEALEARAKEAEETAEARDSVIQSKQKTIATLEEDLHKARHRLHAATPDEVGKQLCQETAGIGWSVVGLINDDLAKGFAALDEHARLNDCTHDEFLSGVLFEIERALNAIREDYAVKARPDGDERPDWTRPDFDPTPAKETIEAMERFEREHGYNPLKAGNA